jgi:hypothetical protein
LDKVIVLPGELSRRALELINRALQNAFLFLTFFKLLLRFLIPRSRQLLLQDRESVLRFVPQTFILGAELFKPAFARRESRFRLLEIR